MNILIVFRNDVFPVATPPDTKSETPLSIIYQKYAIVNGDAVFRSI